VVFRGLAAVREKFDGVHRSHGTGEVVVEIALEVLVHGVRGAGRMPRYLSAARTDDGREGLLHRGELHGRGRKLKPRRGRFFGRAGRLHNRLKHSHSGSRLAGNLRKGKSL
jgi:hypothetical protein